MNMRGNIHLDLPLDRAAPALAEATDGTERDAHVSIRLWTLA